METARSVSPTIDRRRLFLGSCLSLIATSVAFAVVGAVMLPLKSQFVLTNSEIGWIGGAALWGFAVSQLIFSPLCDSLGFRFLMRLAFIAHLVGVLVMMFAGGFWMLFFGAWTIALGNGLVEAACNPLVATLYPDDKTVKLNQFHVWFPGGIVIGGLATYLLTNIGLGNWQLQLGLILIPTFIYGLMMLNVDYPETEGVQAGVSMGEMFKATFLSPFMWLMFFCMMITASTELGPGRWIPAVMEAGGIPGILVLVWGSFLMAILRYFAGPVVHRFSPTGLLFGSAVISAIGLFWLSYSTAGLAVFVAATIFYVGVCYFWPTMLGVVNERKPRTGALGLGVLGAVGMLTAGAITSPLMGEVADDYAHDRLPVQETVALLETVANRYPELAEEAATDVQTDIRSAGTLINGVVTTYEEEGTLPEERTANALRAIQETRTAAATADQQVADDFAGQATSILGPADNYGGRVSFRYIVPFTCILIVIFGIMYWRDRQRGGYQVKKIREEELDEAQRQAKTSV